MAFGELALKPNEFWRLTMRELNELVEGFNSRAERELEIKAWEIASICNNIWSKRRVTINKLLGRKPKQAESGKGKILAPGEEGWDEFIEDFPQSVKDSIKNGRSR